MSNNLLILFCLLTFFLVFCSSTDSSEERANDICEPDQLKDEFKDAEESREAWKDQSNKALVDYRTRLKHLKDCFKKPESGYSSADKKATIQPYLDYQYKKLHEKYCPTLITWMVLAIVFMALFGIMALLLGVSVFFHMAARNTQFTPPRAMPRPDINGCS